MALALVASATATFTGAEDSVAASWSATITGSYKIVAGVTETDSGVVALVISARSGTSVTVQPSARFTGTVELLAYQ